MKTEEENTFELRVYTRKEIRALYGISARNFSTWLKPYRDILPIKKQYLTINQVKFIIEKFGLPGRIKIT